MNQLIEILEKWMLTCPWKSIGLECFGCGFQRAIILILKGEWIAAFYMYPAIYTLLLMFATLGLHLKFDFKNGTKVLHFLFWTNIILIIGSYFFKHN